MAPISQSSTLPALEAFGFEFNTTVGALLIGEFAPLICVVLLTKEQDRLYRFCA